MAMEIGKIFCGGMFCFDFRDVGYELQAAQDYRIGLLGSVDASLLTSSTSWRVMIALRFLIYMII
jgi:hypothetical protein